MHEPRDSDRTTEYTGPSAQSVAAAIELLGASFLSHTRNADLRRRVASGELTPAALLRQLIAIVYRVLFLCLAEEGDLLHPPGSDPLARARYDADYSIRRLRSGTDPEPPGDRHELWARLNTVLRALADPIGHHGLALPGLDSVLWSTRTTPDLNGQGHHEDANSVCLDDQNLLGAVRLLTCIRRGATWVPIELTSATPTMLGSIYEQLLRLVPAVDPNAGALSLRPGPSNARRAHGSFYTPPALIEHILDTALEPALHPHLKTARLTQDRKVEGRSSATEEALLRFRVCDPSVGSGHFLIAAAHRLAGHLARARSGRDDPSPNDRERALRDVIRSCVYGVDLDPMAAELCRLSLWLSARDPGRPLTALNARIRVGNALLGATPECFAESLREPAFGSLAPTSETIDVEADERRRTQRAVRTRTRRHARLLADAWCAAFMWPAGEPPYARPDGERRDDTDAAKGCSSRDPFLQALSKDPASISLTTHREIERLASEHRFFHWHIEFSEVFTRDVDPVMSHAAPEETRTPTPTLDDPGFDVVIGNPPFLNQLESASAPDRRQAAMVRALTGGAVRGYADASAAFLVQATRWCRAGGRVCLVMPQSLLAAKDAGPVRAAVLRAGGLSSLWVSNEHAFGDASVFTCAPTIHIGGPRRATLLRSSGRTCTTLKGIRLDNDQLTEEETWSHLVADTIGTPRPEPSTAGTVADIADATADFRDQYYGLAGFIVEDRDVPESMIRRDERFPRIVTTGLIDPAACHWGSRPARILKRRWTAPRVDRCRMIRDGTLASWIDARLVPKVLLATQTKVLEAYVDEPGRALPSTPLITITPKNPDDLWHIAAALASPACTALAMQRYAGAALTNEAIKLSAKQATRLPLPSNRSAWDRGAHLYRRAQAAVSTDERLAMLIDYANVMCHAFELDDDATSGLMTWWSRRLRGANRPASRTDQREPGRHAP